MDNVRVVSRAKSPSARHTLAHVPGMHSEEGRDSYSQVDLDWMTQSDGWEGIGDAGVALVSSSSGMSSSK